MHQFRHKPQQDVFMRARWVALSIVLATVSAIVVLINPHIAHADIDQATARQLSATGKILPLEKIHEKAKQIKSGKILETELEKKRGKYLYEIELLDENGIVWEVKLDAATGQLIKLEED
jgi:uncharacterized membrane protein YkoI